MSLPIHLGRCCSQARVRKISPSLPPILNCLPLLNQYGVLPRHPSQLYEMVLEGIVLFIILNLFIRKPRPMGAVSGLFLIGYGTFRIIVEAFRQPDAQLGLFDGVISMGQILSVPMVLAGIIMMIWAYRRRPQQQQS
ncbi:Prolipoprotein diacylglyceryl transferase [Serratia fonticola]|uniref:Prolipoprotein diacylglyceryl transferase n=1 Tax=Serratia fonticola TaxID=47917 RepID=A0A4U9V3B4_SERFO|nr:Prolipoprotein diacylglyceryl transferase [Serratia fonticola]